MLIQFIKKVFSKFKIATVNSGIIEKDYIANFLPNNPIIIEAGAHIGIDTVEISQRWPKGKIYAFEPVPELYQRLLDNTQSLQNVSCYSLALADQLGKRYIYLSSGTSDGSSSLLKPKKHLIEHPNVIFKQKIIVQTTTLDLWTNENRIDHVDLLWLDLQGYEPIVLQSSPEILKKVKVIYTEVNLKELYEGAMVYKDFAQWLQQQGFSIVREELPWEDAGNVLFVRQENL